MSTVLFFTVHALAYVESDQLHEDVRSGKDTGSVDDNAPSNGL